MSKGERAFKKLFNTDEPKKHRKGRSETLSTMRNECLYERFCYYSMFSGKRFDLIIESLSKDFFISPVTVSELVNENLTKVSAAKMEFKGLTQVQIKNKLKKKWPQLEWNEILQSAAA